MTPPRLRGLRRAELNDAQVAELLAAAGDREREALERRRAQAAQVFLWIQQGPVPALQGVHSFTVHVINSGIQPAYYIQIKWRQGSAPWHSEGSDVNEFSQLMPRPVFAGGGAKAVS
ncbi:hypothetical protein [Kutzneria sp. NPDC052558]|uniref:hypothetical protein n=1 Tax=Kutzneria sp. NPDC052558 TaxID=3364121 RepID=UPI0037CB3A34